MMFEVKDFETKVGGQPLWILGGAVLERGRWVLEGKLQDPDWGASSMVRQGKGHVYPDAQSLAASCGYAIARY